MASRYVFWDVQVGVELFLDDIPVIQGARECLEQGILSSIHRHNFKSVKHIRNPSQHAGGWRCSLLMDPQTGNPFSEESATA